MCFGVVGEVYGQKNDYIWLSGYESYTVPNTGGGVLVGTTLMNFNTSPVSISYDSIQMNFGKTNTSYCDSSGNLLFYTNGIYIANSLNEKIENSDSLNAGWLQYEWDPSITQYGYRDPEAILAFQDLTNKNHFNLVHSFVDSVPGTGGGNIYGSRIYTTLLDMSANGGHGSVIYKNKTVIHDSLGTELAATRHGNGRDWWLLVQKRNTNCYYRVLIDTGGVKVMPDLNCIGNITAFNDVAAACFSPDGARYVYFSHDSGINIFHFDRCNGELLNPVFIPIKVLRDSDWQGMGVAISPNSRFLYVTATTQIYQYDLEAIDISGSIDTIGLYSNYLSPFSSVFHTAELGTDGKIYISCGNADSVYHVINNPNYKGALCNFVEHGTHLQSVSCGVPSFPNYRLGALAQSQCDSLSTATQDIRDTKEQILKVFPNPAVDVITIDYGFTDWNKGPVSLQITDALGQVVYTQPLPMYSGFQRIDISSFAAGLYNVAIKRSGATVAVSKLVKE